MFVNYNIYKTLKIGQENNFYYIHCLETKKIHNLEPMSHGMMHIVNYMVEFKKLNLYSITKCYIQIQKKVDSIDSKSKKLHPTNIWNDNTSYKINDSCCVIPITNIINIKQYNI
jgi:hypothetical protein